MIYITPHRYFYLLLSIFLGIISCGHKSSVGLLSLSEAERKLAADADEILGLSRMNDRVSKVSIAAKEEKISKDEAEKTLSARKEHATVSVDNAIASFRIDGASIKQYNRFAYGFLASTLDDSKETNRVVCPLSLEMLLSVVANGADSVALEEILRYLKSSSLEELNEMNRSWLWLCRHPGKNSDFSLANSIWVADDIKIERKFKKAVEEDCDGSFYTLDYDPIQSQKEINLWAEKKTHGLIADFLKEPLKKL